MRKKRKQGKHTQNKMVSLAQLDKSDGNIAGEKAQGIQQILKKMVKPYKFLQLIYHSLESIQVYLHECWCCVCVCVFKYLSFPIVTQTMRTLPSPKRICVVNNHHHQIVGRTNSDSCGLSLQRRQTAIAVGFLQGNRQR